MAIKNTITILFYVVAVWLAVDGSSLATRHVSPAPSADCSSIILDVTDCLSYVSVDATLKKPEGTCCSGLKKVLKTDAECLCEALKNSVQFGFTLNMTRALDLPSSCHVSAPSISNCGLSIGTGSAPAGANEIAPAPAPGTTGSASLTATGCVSLVFALVVASSFFV